MFDDPSRTPRSNTLALRVGIAVLLVVGGFLGGVYVGFNKSEHLPNISVFAGTDALPPTDVDFTALWKAWNLLDQKFVPVSSTTATSTSREEQLWGAIEGLARSYGDPYTVFMPPAKASIFADDIRGEFGGVGIEIGIRGGVLTVIAPIKDTPAAKAGILAGDRIVKINDESTDLFAVDEAVSRIRGEIGTDVKLTVVREGQDAFLDFELTRARIEVPTISYELRNDGVYVIELYNFTATSPNLFRRALREFIDSESDKLILDLRGNPGGFLEAAVDMASFFLPAGKVIVTEDFGKNGEPREHRSKGYDIFSENLKMVILVNEGSASASEILAGALQEHEIATLVGSKTFGKGSVQELVDITSDTALKVTVARWITPKGNSISDGGLTPDVEVPVTPEAVAESKDAQLEKAVEILQEMQGDNIRRVLGQ
jgi:carboxyl-terminal processing protease